MESVAVAIAYAVTGSAPVFAAKYGVDITRWRPALGWAVTFSCMFNTSPYLRWIALPHLFFAASTAANPYVFFKKLVHYPALVTLVVGSIGTFMPGLLPANTTWSTLAILYQLVCFAMGFARFMLFPAPLVSSIADIDNVRTKFLSTHAGWERITVPSTAHPGVNLDGMLYRHPAAGAKKWVIYLGGNGEVYEHTTDIVSPIANALQANVLVYNPRGVGHSGGEVRYATDMVKDGSDVINWLLKQNAGVGLRESHILLYGHSIGGGVAAQLVANHHKECSIVIDRSFSSLVDAAVSLGPINSKPVVENALGFIFGDLNTIDAVPKFQHKRVLFTYHEKDQIIRMKESSLCGLYRPKIRQFGEIVEFEGPAQDPHNVPPSTFKEFVHVVESCNKFFYQGEGQKLGASSSTAAVETEVSGAESNRPKSRLFAAQDEK